MLLGQFYIPPLNRNPFSSLLNFTIDCQNYKFLTNLNNSRPPVTKSEFHFPLRRALSQETAAVKVSYYYRYANYSQNQVAEHEGKFILLVSLMLASVSKVIF